jgi:uncharacterized protein
LTDQPGAATEKPERPPDEGGPSFFWRWYARLAGQGAQQERPAMTQPLMPMATAVWLVDNTTLTFQQIADFCGLHILEVQGIADETVASKVMGRDPIQANELTWAEIERCQKDPVTRLVAQEGPDQKRRTKGPRYTPVSKRQDKPDAIAWLLRNHPELTDAQISRLVGTTKPTIAAIRDKSYWNIANVKPQDPVALGLCGQRELDQLVLKMAQKQAGVIMDPGLEAEALRLEDELKRKRAEAQALAAAAAEAAGPVDGQ